MIGFLYARQDRPERPNEDASGSCALVLVGIVIVAWLAFTAAFAVTRYLLDLL